MIPVVVAVEVLVWPILGVPGFPDRVAEVLTPLFNPFDLAKGLGTPDPPPAPNANLFRLASSPAIPFNG